MHAYINCGFIRIAVWPRRKKRNQLPQRSAAATKLLPIMPARSSNRKLFRYIKLQTRKGIKTWNNVLLAGRKWIYSRHNSSCLDRKEYLPARNICKQKTILLHELQTRKDTKTWNKVLLAGRKWFYSRQNPSYYLSMHLSFSYQNSCVYVKEFITAFNHQS